MQRPQPPYAVSVPEFPLPGLAGLTGRAPLGGPRETLVACFVAGRLVRDAVGAGSIDPQIRAARAAGARSWLTSLAMPASVRNAIVRLVESTASDDLSQVRAALSAVIGLTATYLDSPARSDLEHLAQTLGG